LEAPGEERLTVILNRLLQGAAAPSDPVFALIHDELRELARHHMAHQPDNHTLQPTALVNEAWLRLAQRAVEGAGTGVECRRQFFLLASKAMRSVLVDHARARRADKRGGARQRLTLATAEGAVLGPDLDVLALEEALERLEQRDAELSRIVELRFFAGLEHEEVSAIVGVPLRTVERHWRLARAWLHKELSR
jgi:RNA polymerase sigma factor (TIGR02999 family)